MEAKVKLLTLTVFVANPREPTELEAQAVARSRAAAARFPGRVELSVLDLDSEEALLLGAVVSPTIVVGETALAVGRVPMAGQIKRYLQAALDGAI